MLTFGSCYTGLGGFDLGLARAGWRCRWQAERDAPLRRLLDDRWPLATQYEDVEAIADAPKVDLVYGELPSADWSAAGPVVRLALASADWLFIEANPTVGTEMVGAATPLIEAGWQACYRVLRYATTRSGLGRSRVRQRVVVVSSKVGDPVALCAALGLDPETPLDRPDGLPGDAIEDAALDVVEAVRGFPVGWAAGLDETAARAAIAGASSPWLGHHVGKALRAVCERAA
jgi:hypothetical protein